MPETLVERPLDGYEPEVGAALWRLEDARRRTHELLAEMPPEIVDRQAGAGNTIGTVLYHMGLIEADWLYSEILLQPVPPEIERLLPADHRDETGILTVISGETLAVHLERLAAVRATLLHELRGMTAADLQRARSLPAYDVSPAWVLHHLAQHDAEHRAELGAMIARLRDDAEG